VGARILKIGIRNLRELVGEGHLFRQAKNDKQNTAQHFFLARRLPGIEIREELASAHNRPATNCGKKEMYNA